VSPREELAAQLRAIVPVDDRERDSISATLEVLAGAEELFDESRTTHHLTASAFVVSSRGVILHEHRKLHIWVQPGGHVDEGEVPAEAAVRETLEETGLQGTLALGDRVFHVDVHPGPRGHTHYDLRYIIVSEPVDPTPPPEESQEVYWFDFASAVTRCEPALAPALAKLGDWAKANGVTN